MSNEILTKLKSRSYWTMNLRPLKYQADRFASHAGVSEAVRDSSVSLRGWDFPHWDTHAPPARGLNYVEQAVDWEHHLDVWRAYFSGQIAVYTSVWDDWRDKSGFWPLNEGEVAGRTMSFEDIVYRLTEVFEFGARWSIALGDCEALEIRVGLHNVEGKNLTADRMRFGVHRARQISVPEWKHGVSLSKADLLAGATDYAIKPARQLLALFNVDVGDEAVRSQQQRMMYWGDRLPPRPTSNG